MSNFIVAQVTPPIMASISWGLYLILAGVNVLAFLFVRYCLGECIYLSMILYSRTALRRPRIKLLTWLPSS